MAKKSTKRSAPVEPAPQTIDRWQTESDLRTITEAQRIQKDRARLGAVRQMAKQQLNAVVPKKRPGGSANARTGK